MSSTERRFPWETVLLTIGFLAVAGATYAAHRNPATGYEISIYTATPLSFWIGCAVAAAVALSVAVSDRRKRFLPIIVLLGSLTVVLIVSLPVVRGYHFYGAGDTLTHLGWTREIDSGAMNPFELRYPGGHLLASLVTAVFGIELRHALMIVPSFFVFSYLIFTPLTVRTLVTDSDATLIASFAAFLLLPIYNIGTSMMFVPFTLSIFFSAFIIYVLLLLVFSGERRGHVLRSGTGIVFTLAGTGLLFLHPQQMLNILILVATVTAFQLFYRRYRPDHYIATHRTLGGIVFVLAVLFLAWNVNHEAMFEMIDVLERSLFGGSEAGEYVQDRSGSVTDVGASLAELFAKLFLVNLAFILLAMGFVVTVISGKADGIPRNIRATVTYFTVSGLVLGPFFFMHFFGPASTYFFRHLGFGMVVVTLVAVLGIYYLCRAAPGGGRSGRTVLAVIAAVALVLSTAILFTSPYIYLANSHVTEAQTAGYERTFDRQSDDVAFAGLRAGSTTSRHSDAMLGEPSRVPRNVNESMIRSGLSEEFDEDVYFTITESEKQAETIAYKGLRYSRSDFDAISTQRRVSRIQTNGAYELYYVNAAESGS